MPFNGAMRNSGGAVMKGADVRFGSKKADISAFDSELPDMGARPAGLSACPDWVAATDSTLDQSITVAGAAGAVRRSTPFARHRRSSA